MSNRPRIYERRKPLNLFQTFNQAMVVQREVADRLLFVEAGADNLTDAFERSARINHQLLLLLPVIAGCSGTPPSGFGTTAGMAPHSEVSDCVST
jgi:hypothetical protein